MTLKTRPAPLRRTRRAALRSTALAATTSISHALTRRVFAAETSGGSPTPQGTTLPPVARVSPVRETFFGQVVVDPYRWMEDPKDRDWEPFMRGQDAHARRVLHGIPGRDALAQRITSLSGSTTVAVGAVAIGQRLFYEVRPAGADNYMLAVRDQAGGPERILLDPTKLKAPGDVHVSIDWWVPSPDGRHVVYGLSPAGSENSVLHVMQVDTGRVLDERIAGTQYASPSWLPDGSGFFYGRVADPTQLGTVEYYKRSPVLLHRLGDDPKRDRLIVAHGRDPALPLTEVEFPSIACASGSRWAVLTLFGGVRRENPVFAAPLDDVVAGRVRWRQVCAIADEVTATEFDATHLYLLSTRGAPNGQVLRTPLDGGTYRRAERIVREGPKVIESMALARDGLYIADLDGGTVAACHPFRPPGAPAGELRCRARVRQYASADRCRACRRVRVCLVVRGEGVGGVGHPGPCSGSGQRATVA